MTMSHGPMAESLLQGQPKFAHVVQSSANLDTYHHHSYFLGPVPHTNDVALVLLLQSCPSRMGESFNLGNTKMTSLILEVTSYEQGGNDILLLQIVDSHPGPDIMG